MFCQAKTNNRIQKENGHPFRSQVRPTASSTAQLFKALSQKPQQGFFAPKAAHDRLLHNPCLLLLVPPLSPPATPTKTPACQLLCSKKTDCSRFCLFRPVSESSSQPCAARDKKRHLLISVPMPSYVRTHANNAEKVILYNKLLPLSLIHI